MTAATQSANGSKQNEEQSESLLDEILASTPDPIMDRRESAFIGMQLGQASKKARSLRQFIDLATEYATVDEETAASCTYTLPRDGKAISGASIRLLEICAMAWGHIHTEARVVEIGDKMVTIAATTWDMQTNVRMGEEIHRRITKKNGQRYGDDMIATTIAAAMSIAIRNALLRVIPRAFVEKIRLKAAAVVKGDEKTLGARRVAMMQHFGKLGAKEPWVLAAVGRKGIEDVTLDDMVTLKGFATAIKDGEAKIEDVFPDPSKPKQSDRAESVEEKIKAAQQEAINAKTKADIAALAEVAAPKDETPHTSATVPAPLAAGELDPSTPMTDPPAAMTDAEKAAIEAEEAQANAPETAFDPVTASREELLAAVRAELARLGKTEGFAGTMCGMPSLKPAKDGNLRYMYGKLKEMPTP